jgi:hypothetical protein
MERGALLISRRRARGLGRGLGVLFGGAGGQAAQLPVGVTQSAPAPKRQDARGAHGLADSVPGREQRLSSGAGARRVRAIAGERRWRAARRHRSRPLPAIVRRLTTAVTAASRWSNVAREDLSPVEEARVRAADPRDSVCRSARFERVGRSKPAVSNRMRLLDLSDDMLAMVERGELSEGMPLSRCPSGRPPPAGRGLSRRECRCARPSSVRVGPVRVRNHVKAAPVDPTREACALCGGRLRGCRPRGAGTARDPVRGGTGCRAGRGARAARASARVGRSAPSEHGRVAQPARQGSA